MNALRNITRTLTCLHQNVLLNFTQPADSPAAKAGSTTVLSAAKNNNNADKRRPKPLLISKSIVDATSFGGKQYDDIKTGVKITKVNNGGSISPTTLRHYRRIERKVELVYRCKLCNTRNNKLVTEAAYQSGVVILQCDGCAVNHLIIDNLGWFAKTKTGSNGGVAGGKARHKSFDEVLAEQGDRVRIIKVNEHGDLI